MYRETSILRANENRKEGINFDPRKGKHYTINSRCWTKRSNSHKFPLQNRVTSQYMVSLLTERIWNNGIPRNHLLYVFTFEYVCGLQRHAKIPIKVMKGPSGISFPVGSKNSKELDFLTNLFN